MLDLFSGLGGFALAFERAGFKTVAFSEVDPFCRRVLAHHWPAVPNLGDVREVDGGRIGTPVEVLVGGFPCQDISAAGKGAGLDGDRSGLWFEMLRLVRELRPRWVVAENVPALRTRGADTLLAGLEAAGYACWPTVVGAWAVGAPHRRDRVWVVGRLADANRDALRHESGRRGGQDGAGTCVTGLADAGIPRLAGRRALPGSVGAEVTVSAGGGKQRWPARPGEPQHEWEAPRVVESGLGGTTDGTARRLARRAERRRREQLRALGNAVVWQVPHLFALWIAAQERRAA